MMELKSFLPQGKWPYGTSWNETNVIGNLNNIKIELLKLKERIWHDTVLEKEKAEKDTVIVDILDQF